MSEKLLDSSNILDMFSKICKPLISVDFTVQVKIQLNQRLVYSNWNDLICPQLPSSLG